MSLTIRDTARAPSRFRLFEITLHSPSAQTSLLPAGSPAARIAKLPLRARPGYYHCAGWELLLHRLPICPSGSGWQIGDLCGVRQPTRHRQLISNGAAGRVPIGPAPGCAPKCAVTPLCSRNRTRAIGVKPGNHRGPADALAPGRKRRPSRGDAGGCLRSPATTYRQEVLARSRR